MPTTRHAARRRPAPRPQPFTPTSAPSDRALDGAPVPVMREDAPAPPQRPRDVARAVQLTARPDGGVCVRVDLTRFHVAPDDLAAARSLLLAQLRVAGAGRRPGYYDADALVDPRALACATACGAPVSASDDAAWLAATAEHAEGSAPADVPVSRDGAVAPLDPSAADIADDAAPHGSSYDLEHTRTQLLDHLDELDRPAPTHLTFAISPGDATGTGRPLTYCIRTGDDAIAGGDLPFRFASPRRSRRYRGAEVNPLRDALLEASRYAARRAAFDRALLTHEDERDPILVAAIGSGMVAEVRDRELGREFMILTRMAAELWNAVLRRLEPHLDARAYRLARSCHRGSDLYNLLTTRPHLADLVDQARPAGLLLHEETADVVRPGLTLPEALHALLIADPAIRSMHRTFLDRVATRGDARYRGLAPRYRNLQPATVPHTPDDPSLDACFPRPAAGFVAWCRGMRWTPAHLPGFHESKFGILHAAYLAGDVMDPNRVRQLRRPREWYLVNYCLRNCWSTEPLQLILQAPAAAARAVEQYYGPDRGGYRGLQLVKAVFSEISDMMYANHALTPADLETLPPEERAYVDGDDTGAAFPSRFLSAPQSPVRRAQSLARLAELAHRYHVRLRGERADRLIAEALANPVTFPAPAFETATARGYTMRWLGDSVALAREGARMAHCVATYSHACARGTSVIYTVERTDGTPAGTVEVRGDTYQIMQYRTFRNHKPEARAEQAVRTMLRQVQRARRNHVRPPDAGAHPPIPFPDDDLPF